MPSSGSRARGPLRVAVAGGSIGGLCAAVVLRGAGCAVDVYERSAGPLTGRGAGIVVQPELLALLRRHGAPELPTTCCSRRRYLAPEGGAGAEAPMPQRFTSWGTIHRTLRAAFPDERYLPGRTLTDFDPAAVGGGVTARFGTREAVVADLLVCADGWRSAARRRLLPDVRPRYAGYVAWRGTLGEADAPADLAAFFDDRFTFSEARAGGHALCYLIPGEDGSAAPGRRRLNWVWYVGADAAALDRLLTDRRGERHAGSVPPGEVPLPLVEEARAEAGRELHPRFAELVRATPEPFLQAVADLAVPRLAFGRACLVGDAAFVVRPHTAGSTAKAAADALALGSAVAASPADPDGALRRWEAERLAAGLQMVRYGVALGARFAAAR